jgi:hypothetical protein
MTFKIAGHVLDGGSPVEGSKVQLFIKRNDTCIGHVTSGSDGSFQFTGLSSAEPNEYFVVAHDVAQAGSLVIFDDSTSRTWTLNGSATTSKRKRKYGKAGLTLDGAGYATTPAHTDFDVGADAFCIDFWVNTTVTTDQWILSKTSATGGLQYEFAFGISSTYAMFYYGIRGSNQSIQRMFFPTTMPDNTFAHVSIGRDATGKWRCSLNGILSTSYQLAPLASSLTYGGVTQGNYTDAVDLGSPSIPVTIGAFGGYYSSNPFAGAIDELRFIKGAYPYTVSNDVPTDAFAIGSTTNTKALLHFNGANASTTFADEYGTTWTAGGSAQLATAIKKFGTASGVFNGSSDYLSAPNTAIFDLSSADFTIEAWIYPTTVSSGVYTIFSVRNTSNAGITFCIYNGNLLFYASGYGNCIGSATISTSVWTHVACVKRGSVASLFVNGVLDGTFPVSSINYLGTHDVLIGKAQASGLDYYYSGYIDEFRLVNGVAVYSEHFTPPTRLQVAGDHANTKSLVHMKDFSLYKAAVVDQLTAVTE